MLHAFSLHRTSALHADGTDRSMDPLGSPALEEQTRNPKFQCIDERLDTRS